MSATLQIPTSANNYLVQFHDYGAPNNGEASSVKLWANPYANEGMSTIPCFIPKCFLETTEKFKAAINNAHLKSIFFLDPFKNALVPIDLQDLKRFCVVDKCCYIVAKSDSIWQQKIKFTFSNLTCIPANKCSYSPERQFQVAFKEFQYRQRPYLCQYKHNLKKYNNKIPDVVWYQGHVNAIGLRINAMDKKLNELIHLFGSECVGTVASIGPESQQARCLDALDFVNDEINQEAFELRVRASECAASKAPDLGHTRELQGVYCGMGPDDDDYFSTIERTFRPESPVLTGASMGATLSAFQSIQSTELKMKAFTLILVSYSVADKSPIAFYEALPEVLQNKLKRQMLDNGHVLNADQLLSQSFKEAAFQVYRASR